MDDILAVVFAIVCYSAIFGGMFLYRWYFYAKREQSGYITLNNGHVYTYYIGNNLRSYGASRFDGVEVQLPKDFPHVYLDSQVGGGRHARFYPDPSQLLHLEGDFSSYYRVFVPKRYEAVVLSVLSPDVMAALVDYATDFDVEIYKDRLRIISSKRVYKRPERQEALLAVAIEILAEVDHRVQSWSRSSETQSFEQDLHMYPVSGFRIGQFHVHYMWLLWLGILLPVWVGTIYNAQILLDEGNRSEAIRILAVGIGATGGAATVISLLAARVTRFKSRRPLGILDRWLITTTGVSDHSPIKSGKRPPSR